jgi:uncharacterized protein (DUF1330 family)
MEFESLAAARQWYQSPAYQKAVSIRQAAAEAKVGFVVDGGLISALNLAGPG